MAARGWAYYPQTMQRVEAGHRKVSVGEAEALARILHTTMERLTWPGQMASAASLLDTFTGRANKAYGEIARWTTTLLLAQRQLATTVAEAERNALHGSDQLGALVAEAREATTMNPEDAVSTGRLDYQETVAAVPAGRPALQASPKPRRLDGNCMIIFIEVGAFSSPILTDEHRRIIRHEMFNMTAASLAPIWDQCSPEDRGDGLLIVVPPSVPPAQVLEYLHESLPRALRRHNSLYAPGAQFQLRVAVDVGSVMSDDHGVSGKVIINTARLLNAPALKDAMTEHHANLGIIVSDSVYQTVIWHTDVLGDPGAFTEIDVAVKETTLRGWMLMIDPALRPGSPTPEAGPASSSPS